LFGGDQEHQYGERPSLEYGRNLQLRDHTDDDDGAFHLHVCGAVAGGVFAEDRLQLSNSHNGE
jgi:hypothetical protein